MGGPDGTANWPSAKIRVPRPRALVSRPRLVAQLDVATPGGRVVLLVAPGGTGKTTLVADWAGRAPLPVAWYALDATDRDPRRLAEGLCAAVEVVLPGAASSARAGLAGGMHEAAAMGLLLGALDGRPLALVVDDFQWLDDAPGCLALWDHVLRFRPPELSLVVLSRTVPVLGFIALASLDLATGLGFEDLRFRGDEAHALLEAHGFDAGQGGHFAERSGGWAAGVLLQALTAPTGVRVLRARTEVLMEHLGDELLASLPPPLRAFLLTSSCLGPATPADADALLGRDDSAICYAELAARGLFLERDGDTYRYHDLFAEYLMDRLRREDPQGWRAIRRAAANWWAARGELPRTLGMLSADDDWEALARTLDRERATLWAHGLGGTVLMHMERLPREYRTPRLLALCGYVLSQRGEHAEALALADAGMAAAADDEEWLSPALLRVQALVYAGRDEPAVRSATAALDVAHRIEHEVAMTQLRELRGTARLRMGDLADGEADMRAALAVYWRDDDRDGEARVLFNLATQLIAAGRAGVARPHLAEAEALWTRLGRDATRGDVLLSKALLLCLVGDYVGARADAEAARAAARAGGYPLVECEAGVVLARIHACDGASARAERLAVDATEMAMRLDLGDVLNEARRVRIAAALLRRDRAAARALIDEALPFAATPADRTLLDVLDGTLALRSRAHRRALALLTGAAEALAPTRPHRAAEAYLLCAESALALDRVRCAEEALNRMAQLVLPLGAEGSLRPAARFAPHVAANRRLLRHIRRDTRLLLDRLMGTGPHLSLVRPEPEAGDEGAPRPPLRVSPFGQGHAALGDYAILPTALPPKARELLFYAAHAARPLSREEIIDALWGGDDASAPALWNATRHLRRVLGDEGWGKRERMYGLRMPIEDDEQRFHAAVARALDAGEPAGGRVAAAEEALAVVGEGGYLEWCDSPWAMSARNQTARRALDAALALARLCAESGRDEDAVAAYRRAIALDPLGERPRRALLRHLLRTGKPRAARREYDDYTRLVRAELGAEPSPELQAVVATASGRALSEALSGVHTRRASSEVDA